ncbi:unnamed protein product [Dovyalis caffra]|uniref:Uncharacterized protein n=1 Tax=Dovyalis caffra TaxID=77055 RepID=A0AAV1S152_9ROSI|nr:unnamed protein product [Dovyalis caffra]
MEGSLLWTVESLKGTMSTHKELELRVKLDEESCVSLGVATMYGSRAGRACKEERSVACKRENLSLWGEGFWMRKSCSRKRRPGEDGLGRGSDISSRAKSKEVNVVDNNMESGLAESVEMVNFASSSGPNVQQRWNSPDSVNLGVYIDEVTSMDSDLTGTNGVYKRDDVVTTTHVDAKFFLEFFHSQFLLHFYV